MTPEKFTDVDASVRTIGGLWLNALARWPDRPFLGFGDERLTVSQLHDRVLRWVREFDRLDLNAGDPVALLMGNCTDYAALLIAIGATGRIAVPINAELVGEVLTYPIIDANARLLIVDEKRAEIIAALELPPDIHVMLAGRDPDRFNVPLTTDAAPAFAAVARGIRRDDPCVVLYTSGTTGPPKGAVLPQEYYAFLGWSSASSNGFAEGDVVFVILPLFHINAQASLFGAMLSGVEVALEPRFSASTFWRRIHETRATHLSLIGMVGNVLLKRPESEFVPGHRVRIAIVVPAPEPVEEFESRFGLSVFANAYGMTEAPICPPSRNGKARTGLIGQAIEYFDMALVDDADELLGDDQVGEIVVRPRLPNIMFREYLGKPEATVAAWRNLWFHTGDLGRRDGNGDYWFVGRKKECIRRRGENIAPVQIERVALKLPEVVEAAAIAVPSRLGEDEIKLVAVNRQGVTVKAEDVWKACAAELPRYMWPAYVEVVDQLPKNASHRVLRDQLTGLDGPGLWTAPDGTT